MGWKFRKRIKVAPGVNVNMSHRGFGMSVGNKYGRVSVGPSGRVTGTQSIPGTGLYRQETIYSPKKGRKQQAAQAVVTVNRPTPFLVRMLYFVLIGWWATMLWWTLALVLMCTLIGIPLGLRMFRMTGSVLTLA